MPRLVNVLGLLIAVALLRPAGGVRAGEPNYLFPDMFPYVEIDAPGNLQSLQNWTLFGNEIRFNTLFANQGDGLFEIRRGPSIDADFDTLIQRVYIDTDFGPTFQDFSVGQTRVPGTPSNPNPNVVFPTDPNVIWFDDFTTFSLHEAPVVDGLLTVGAEVASRTKTSWRLSANRGPLPDYNFPPNHFSTNQSIEQRISVGWADLYIGGSPGQSIDITGVPAGPLYWLRQTVDPADQIMETDETNNSFEILIDLNNPGEAIAFAGDFVQPGDPEPPIPGDLTQDGQVDVDDWLAFKAGADVSLDGLSPHDAYLLGDLNSDGTHSLGDVVLFGQLFDQANGAGAFSAIESSVPEPSAAALLACAAALVAGRVVGRRRRAVRPRLIGIVIAAFVFSSAARTAIAQASLEVNTDTGELTITGAQDLTGYEITSPSASLDHLNWVRSNLDARNFGSPTSLTADFNNDGRIDGADYTVFRDNVGPSLLGDADGDFFAGPTDYSAFASQYGGSVANGESWETVVAGDDHFIEFFLFGESTFASASIGLGYDALQDARDLTFRYSTVGGNEFVGAVTYAGAPPATSVPEPHTLAAALLGCSANLLKPRCRRPAARLANRI